MNLGAKLTQRCRRITQRIIEAIGSVGPEDAEQAVERVLAQLAAANAQRDELLRAAKHAEAFVWGEEGVAMLERKVPSQEWVREFHNRRDSLREAIARAQSGQPAHHSECACEDCLQRDDEQPASGGGS